MNKIVAKEPSGESRHEYDEGYCDEFVFQLVLIPCNHFRKITLNVVAKIAQKYLSANNHHDYLLFFG